MTITGPQTTVAKAAVEGDWQVYEGDEENLLRARFNKDYIKATDRSDYPVETVVTVLLDNPEPDEMPHGSLLDELAHVEELIIQLEHEQAVFAGAVTTPETQSFVLYARSSEWIAEVHAEIEMALGDQPVQFMTKTDPEWSSYCELVEAST